MVQRFNGWGKKKVPKVPKIKSNGSDSKWSVCDLRRLSFVHPHFSSNGFTLMEIMIALCIIGILAAIAIPSVLNQREDARIAKTITDINNVSQMVLESFYATKVYPNSLSEVGMGGLKDPWWNAYEYLPMTESNKVKCRKDRNLNPINTDFDLYSKGKDGNSVSPLTAKASRDDIVRANNGTFVGLASNY